MTGTGDDASETPGAALARSFVAHSPFARQLCLVLEHADAERAVVSMPYDEQLVTVGETLHGGAIAALVDTAATAAAWAGLDAVTDLRGATVSLAVDYLSPARGDDTVAEARIVKRGSRMCFCQVEVTAAARPVATGRVIYALGG